MELCCNCGGPLPPQALLTPPLCQEEWVIRGGCREISDFLYLSLGFFLPLSSVCMDFVEFQELSLFWFNNKEFGSSGHFLLCVLRASSFCPTLYL